MASSYRLQIVHSSGRVVVSWPPGKQEERDLVHAIVTDAVARAKAQGFGVFKTEAQVEATLHDALRQALQHLLRDAKEQVTK